MGIAGLFAVTGGGSGIGRGVSRKLAEEGGRVAVLDANGSAAEKVAKEVGGEAHVLDVSDPAAVGQVFGMLGPLQGLVTCAGISDVTPIVAMTAQTWRRVTGVQLDGTFFCLQAAVRNMIAHGMGGAIVNTASINATFGHRGLSAYSAAKAGIAMLTRIAARPGLRPDLVGRDTARPHRPARRYRRRGRVSLHPAEQVGDRAGAGGRRRRLPTGGAQDVPRRGLVARGAAGSAVITAYLGSCFLS